MKWNALRILGLLFGIGLANLACAADSGDEIAHQPMSDCKISLSQSLEELKSAALADDQGDIEAQNILGLMYSLGCGVPQDHKEALIWFGLAADHGDIEAQFEVGAIYALGFGTPIDYELAVKWYSLSADQGNPTAQGELGVMYANGSGVQQDKIVAYALYNLCIANDSSDTNRILFNRVKLAMDMSIGEIKAADALTLEIAKPGNLLKSIEHFITNLSILSAANRYFPKITAGPREGLHVLAHDHRSNELHHLVVPTNYLRENLDKLVIRQDKDRISIALSTSQLNFLQDVRPGGAGIHFAQFRRNQTLALLHISRKGE